MRRVHGLIERQDGQQCSCISNTQCSCVRVFVYSRCRDNDTSSRLNQRRQLGSVRLGFRSNDHFVFRSIDLLRSLRSVPLCALLCAHADRVVARRVGGRVCITGLVASAETAGSTSSRRPASFSRLNGRAGTTEPRQGCLRLSALGPAVRQRLACQDGVAGRAGGELPPEVASLAPAIDRLPTDKHNACINALLC